MSPEVLDSLLLWLHLVTGVFLVGYGLFWTIVAVPFASRSGSGEMEAFLAEVKGAKWPPFGPVRLSLPVLGWLGFLGMGLTGYLLGRGDEAGFGASTPKLAAFGFAFLLHVLLSLRPSRGLVTLFLVALLATVVLSVVPGGYRGTLLAVHLLAVMIWLGHMFFWSFVVGPLCKRYQPEEKGAELREASHRWGALGGGALLVLFLTGTMMLLDRGDMPAALPWKLGLVALMVLYQMFVGHRRAPKLIYANMLTALVILVLSIQIVHGS